MNIDENNYKVCNDCGFILRKSSNVEHCPICYGKNFKNLSGSEDKKKEENKEPNKKEVEKKPIENKKPEEVKKPEDKKPTEADTKLKEQLLNEKCKNKKFLRRLLGIYSSKPGYAVMSTPEYDNLSSNRNMDNAVQTK